MRPETPYEKWQQELDRGPRRSWIVRIKIWLIDHVFSRI